MIRVIAVAFALVMINGISYGQPVNVKNPALLNLDGVSISQLAVPVVPALGWYHLARGDSSEATTKMKDYWGWRDTIIDAVKAEIAKSELALETPESQTRRMEKNDSYSAPKVRPYVEVHQGWYRARLRLEQYVELPNGQYAGDPVTYETEASVGKLGSEPLDTIVQAVRSEVDEFLRDWRKKNK